MIEIPPPLEFCVIVFLIIGLLTLSLVVFSLGVWCVMYLIEVFGNLIRKTRIAKRTEQLMTEKLERDLRKQAIRELKAEQIRREIDQAKQQEELRRI